MISPAIGTIFIKQVLNFKSKLIGINTIKLLFRWRDWIAGPGFDASLVECGPITKFSRMFMLDQTTTVTSASGTVETLHVGNTYVTVGFDGYHVLEVPGLGLQPDHPTPSLPIYQEMQLLYAKLYRISQNHIVKTHPALRLFHRPLLAFNDLITRSVDRYLPTRTCKITKVINAKFQVYNCFSGLSVTSWKLSLVVHMKMNLSKHINLTPKLLTRSVWVSINLDHLIS